jgi:hypothetical protein
MARRSLAVTSYPRRVLLFRPAASGADEAPRSASWPRDLGGRYTTAIGLTVPNLRHLEWLHDHVRIESMFFDGALDPAGGTITPDPDAPGLGLTLRATDAERWRTR